MLQIISLAWFIDIRPTDTVCSASLFEFVSPVEVLGFTVPCIVFASFYSDN